MGSIIQAIRDDIEEYQRLCEKYGEEVQTSDTAQGIPLPDCYGKHAKELEERQRKEWDEERSQQEKS